MATFDLTKFHKDMKLFPFVFNRDQLKILNTAMFLYLKNVRCFDNIEIYGSEMVQYVNELQIAMNLRYDIDYVLQNDPESLYYKPFNVD